MPKQKTTPNETTTDGSRTSSIEEPVDANFEDFEDIKRQLLDSRIISLSQQDVLRVLKESFENNNTAEGMSQSILRGLVHTMDAFYSDVAYSCHNALRYVGLKDPVSSKEDLEHALRLLGPVNSSDDTEESDDLPEDPLNMMYRRYVFKAQDASGRRISVCSKRDPGSSYYDERGNETWVRDTTIEKAKRIRGWTEEEGHVMVDPETGGVKTGYTLQRDGTYIQGCARPPHSERSGASDQRSDGPLASMASSVPESTSRRRGPPPPSMSTGRTGIVDPTRSHAGYSRLLQASFAPGVARPTADPSSKVWSGPVWSSIGGLHQYPTFTGEHWGLPQMLMVPLQTSHH